MNKHSKEKRIPLNPFKGFVFIKIFKYSAFESSRLKPLKKLLSIGIFKIYLVVHTNPRLRTDKKYRKKYLEAISQYVKLKIWHDDSGKNDNPST